MPRWPLACELIFYLLAQVDKVFVCKLATRMASLPPEQHIPRKQTAAASQDRNGGIVTHRVSCLLIRLPLLPPLLLFVTNQSPF